MVLWTLGEGLLRARAASGPGFHLQLPVTAGAHCRGQLYPHRAGCAPKPHAHHRYQRVLLLCAENQPPVSSAVGPLGMAIREGVLQRGSIGLRVLKDEKFTVAQGFLGRRALTRAETLLQGPCGDHGWVQLFPQSHSSGSQGWLEPGKWSWSGNEWIVQE